ncbi:MFS transporter, partial [Klebsiella michiganensis]
MTTNPTPTNWLPLVVLCCAQFLASADNVTLSIATQALMNDLHATLGQVSTANTMYPLIAGTFMVAGGMLGCIWGWRMLFRIGCLIFILAEACAFFSPSIALFTWGARLTAGIGGSLMIPAVFGLISALYQQRRRVAAFGALGASSGISFACGPIVCGYLLDHVGWRIAFASLGLLA